MRREARRRGAGTRRRGRSPEAAAVLGVRGGGDLGKEREASGRETAACGRVRMA